MHRIVGGMLMVRPDRPDFLFLLHFASIYSSAMTQYAFL